MRVKWCRLVPIVLMAVGLLRGSDDKKSSGSEELPKHLVAAQELLKSIKLEDTSYKHGEPAVTWKGEDGAGKCVSHTDCSGFIDVLLMHSYGYDRDALKKWLGKKRPTADCYHDKIVDEVGFMHIAHLKDAKPGDLLAVKYLTRTDNTGHMMLVASTPKKVDATKPIVKDTEQWEVLVIDSSESGHGPHDTRHGKGQGSKDHDGVGQGVLRIYTNADGSVAGFTWSTLTASTFKDPKEEHLVIGRLKVGYKP
jgi:hypothetical protein